MYLGNERRQEGGVHAEDWRKTMSRRCCDENLKRRESIGVLYAFSTVDTCSHKLNKHLKQFALTQEKF